MKTFVHIAVYTLVLLGFYSCNSDVFIDDIRPSVSELTLDGNGDSTIIHFASSSWDRLRLNTVQNFPYIYKVYDADGNLIKAEEVPELEGLGKIVCEDLVDFTVERITPQDVKITVRENALDFPYRCSVEASNEYEYQSVTVDIQPSERYVLKRITYSLNAYLYEKQIREKSQDKVYNNGNATISSTFFPYINEFCKMEFISDDPVAFTLLGEKTLVVEVPTIKDGSLVMNGSQAVYTSDQQDLPLPFPLSDTISAKVVFPAHTCMRATLLLEYDWFGTEYTLYAIQPKKGKQRIIKGRLQGRVPKGHFIKREIINEQE